MRSLRSDHDQLPTVPEPSTPPSSPPPSSLALGSGRVELAWLKTTWLYANMGIGLAALPALSSSSFLTSFVLAFLTLCVGHSVGLHRGIIHKTYVTSRVVRWGFALLFAFSGLGGPIYPFFFVSASIRPSSNFLKISVTSPVQTNSDATAKASTKR